MKIVAGISRDSGAVAAREDDPGILAVERRN